MPIKLYITCPQPPTFYWTSWHPDSPGNQPISCLLSPLHRLRPSLPLTKCPYITSCSYSMSGYFPKNNICPRHVPWPVPRLWGRREAVSGLIHRPARLPARLVKEVSGHSFPPPTSTQTNTYRRSVKRPVSKTVCPLTDLDINLARSSVFSLQIITIFRGDHGKYKLL